MRGVVPHDGQPGEVGRLVHTGDHGGQRQVQGGRELGQGRRLADAGLSPKEYGEVGGHGQGQRLQLGVGAGFGACLAQEGQQVGGDVELSGGSGRGKGSRRSV